MPAHIKFSDKFSRSEKQKAYQAFWAEMMPKVSNVVAASFDKGNHAMRHPTRHEIKRRVDLCKDLVDTMRQQFKWSKWRIVDTLPYALRCRLSGIHVPLDRLARRGSF